jgi:tripartite-type tricarboxylate transporter receptor subunit TctC
MQRRAILNALAGLTLTGTAWGQTWPNKPIKIVVPFPAGGTSDVLARLIGQKLSDALGQPVLVENKPGSNGNLGADAVAKSSPDGHTLLLMDVGNLAISPSLFKLPFQVEKDFAPVAMVAYSPHLLVVSPNVPAKTTRELIDWVKSQKGKVNFAAASGMGGAIHLAGVMFALRTGIEWGYVPYKGGAQAITDLIGGQIDVTFNGMVATYPHVAAGKIKLIAVSSAKRVTSLPDVPTVAETLPGFLTGSWQGLLAPAGTPKSVVEQLNAHVVRILAMPDIRERLNTLGADATPWSPGQFGDWLAQEIQTSAKVVREGRISAE